MNLLDIIIPQYKEDENAIKPLLDSISNQEAIDFKQINIIIVNDASDVKLNNDFLKSYKDLNIIYLENKVNSGPGVARQTGLDYSKALYVTFIDADDTFADKYSLYVPLSCIKEINPPLVFTSFMQEIAYGEEIKYKIRKQKETFGWLHGKFIERKFLDDYGIKFHPSLRFCEDSYFFTSIMGVIKNYQYIDYCTYLWKLNPNSITRNKAGYNPYIKYFDDFYRCPMDLYDFLNNHNSHLLDMYIIKSLFGIFIVLESSLFDHNDLKHKQNEYRAKFSLDVKKYIKHFEKYNKKQLKEIFNEELESLKSGSKELKLLKTFDNIYNLIK